MCQFVWLHCSRMISRWLQCVITFLHSDQKHIFGHIKMRLLSLRRITNRTRKDEFPLYIWCYVLKISKRNPFCKSKRFTGVTWKKIEVNSDNAVKWLNVCVCVCYHSSLKSPSICQFYWYMSFLAPLFFTHFWSTMNNIEYAKHSNVYGRRSAGGGVYTKKIGQTTLHLQKWSVLTQIEQKWRKKMANNLSLLFLLCKHTYSHTINTYNSKQLWTRRKQITKINFTPTRSK